MVIYFFFFRLIVSTTDVFFRLRAVLTLMNRPVFALRPIFMAWPPRYGLLPVGNPLHSNSISGRLNNTSFGSGRLSIPVVELRSDPPDRPHGQRPDDESIPAGCPL